MAIVTPNHVLICPHRCGTTYCLRVLRAAYGDQCRLVNENMRHMPLSMVPRDVLKGRKLLGIVRNPFAWYASRWNYLLQTGESRDVPRDFGTMLRRHIGQFRSLFYNPPDEMLHPPIQAGAFTWAHLVYHLPDWNRSRWEIQSQDDIARLLHQEIDGANTYFGILKTASLRSNLLTYYGRIVGPHLTQFRNAYPVDWRALYTPELRNLVVAMDSAALDYYGYRCQ